MKNPLYRAITSALTLLLLSSISAFSAAELEIAVIIGLKHTDNATLTDTKERSEFSQHVGIDVSFRREGSQFSADIDYRGERSNYEHGTTQDTTIIKGITALTWTPLPQRFSWHLGHQRRELLQKAGDADIRDNREIRDIIATGPEFTARLSPVDDLTLTLEYVDVSYSGTNKLDSERNIATLDWSHKLSKTRLLGAGYEFTDVDIETTDGDLEYQRAYMYYSAETPTGDYAMTLGVNEATRDNSEDTDGHLARIKWNYGREPHHFTVLALNGLTDSSIGGGIGDFLGGNSNPDFDEDFDQNFESPDVIERSLASFAYAYDRLCQRCTAKLGILYKDDDYQNEEVLKDEKRTTFFANLEYRLTNQLELRLTGRYSEIEFTNDPDDREDDRTTVRATLRWQPMEKLFVSLFTAHDSRDSSASENDYDELYGGVALLYQLR